MFASSSGGLTIERRADGRRHIVRLTGDLARPAADTLLAFVEEQCVPNEEIVLDLRGVTFIDSSGVRAILDAHRRCDQMGGSLTATPASPQVQRVLERVFQITGLERIGPLQSGTAGGLVGLRAR